MNTSKFTSRILLLALAFGSVACRQTSALGADGPAADVKPPSAAPAAAAPSGHPSKAPIPGALPNVPQVIAELHGLKPNGGERSEPFETPGEPTDASDASPSPSSKERRAGSKRSLAAQDVPVVLTTEPIDALAQGEWIEDLCIMNKLFRGALDDGLVMLGVQVAAPVRQAPMYVEGAGVVLTAYVNWPLAAGRVDGDKSTATRDTDTPWERAKREVSGADYIFDLNIDDGTATLSNNQYGLTIGSVAPVFDPKRLDHLLEDILTVLPQASNFRYLKPSESVIVTLVGSDDAGRPTRLTMKAKKADIDEAAAKKIDAATFKKRITQRIG